MTLDQGDALIALFICLAGFALVGLATLSVYELLRPHSPPFNDEDGMD